MRGPRALATLLFAFALTPSTTLGQVPTPESVLGYPVGSDFELANYEQSIAYFEALDAASDRIELREIGRTSFGRPSYIALISSAENLRDVERYREIAQQLAYPSDDMTDDDARRLAAEGKAIVHIDGGMHASEVAHAQHTIQLAYDLVTGDDGHAPPGQIAFDDVQIGPADPARAHPDQHLAGPRRRRLHLAVDERPLPHRRRRPRRTGAGGSRTQ